MKTTTFYSYKGGVGRSLTLSNIAMRLADLGKKVCMVDFDLEAPGLHHKFNKYIDKNSIKKGVVEYLSDFQEKGILPNKINDFAIKVSYVGTLKGSINLIPAGNINGTDYWRNLASLNWKELFYSGDKNLGVNLLLHFKELIRQDLKPDFILIDSRTGITDISGIAMTLLADNVVILAANNIENIMGTANVIKSLKDETNNIKGIAPKIHFVLSRIPFYPNPEEKHKEIRIINKTKYLINKQEKLVEKILVIHSDRDLEEEEKFKINSTSFFDTEIVPIEEDYLALFEEITLGELEEDEIKKFNDLRESELLIEEARNNRDNAMKIELLNKALKLNKKSHEAYSLLGHAFNEIKKYEQAIKHYERAIKINPADLNYKFFRAMNLKKVDRNSEAVEIVEHVLSKDRKHLGSLLLLTDIFYDRKDYKKSLEINKKIIKYHPDYAFGYNLVGNIYRVLGDTKQAFKYVYKCLELKPNEPVGTLTLAEIYAELNNDDEFYKNLQLAFTFGISSSDFQEIIEEEDIYSKYFEKERFLNLLKSYRIKVNL